MGEKFFLSEQEIKKRYGKSIAYIKEIWDCAYIYYDSENDQFIKSSYHEEYLDTGTVWDGLEVISDGDLWRELVRTCNEDGLSVFLKHRNQIPEPCKLGKMVTMDDFSSGIYALNKDIPWPHYEYQKVGSIIIVKNQNNSFLGVVGKAENYCFFYNPNSDVKLIGFQVWEEALAFALEKATFHHDCVCESLSKVSKENETIKQIVNQPTKKQGLLRKFFSK